MHEFVRKSTDFHYNYNHFRHMQLFKRKLKTFLFTASYAVSENNNVCTVCCALGQLVGAGAIYYICCIYICIFQEMLGRTRIFHPLVFGAVFSSHAFSTLNFGTDFSNPAFSSLHFVPIFFQFCIFYPPLHFWRSRVFHSFIFSRSTSVNDKRRVQRRREGQGGKPIRRRPAHQLKIVQS